MKVYKSIIASVLVILGAMSIVFLETQRARSMNTASRNQPNPLPLISYLGQLGDEYNCFFTVEVASKDPDDKNRIDSHWITRQPAKKDLEQELEDLRQATPNFAYEVDKSNPRILHVMDARLTQQEGYALESIIETINFVGKVNDFPLEIGKQGIPISPPLVMSFDQSRDYTTVVQVKGVRLKVRDALSDFLPLEKRRTRILWIASTKINRPREVSYVYYPYAGNNP